MFIDIGGDERNFSLEEAFYSIILYNQAQYIQGLQEVTMFLFQLHLFDWCENKLPDGLYKIGLVEVFILEELDIIEVDGLNDGFVEFFLLFDLLLNDGFQLYVIAGLE